MTAAQDPDTELLLASAAQGNTAACQALLARHRQRLRQVVALRLDRRLAARVDASDVVQEALAEAAQKLPEYLDRRPLPFYPWLRQLALERLAQQRGACGRPAEPSEHRAGVLRRQRAGRPLLCHAVHRRPLARRRP